MTTSNLTREQQLALVEILGNRDVDVLKELLQMACNAAIQAQFDAHIGADRHERSDERVDQRNGSRMRGLNTRAGSIDLEIPRSRSTNFQPAITERFKRSERALIAVIQEAFVSGVSTRKMEGVLSALGVERIGKSQVSELCEELDAKAAAFRNRELTVAYPYIWLDALYEKVHQDERVVSNAVVIAYGVKLTGERDIIGIDVVDTESKESWSTFLRHLRKRGLTGTKLVISDAHEGLKGAIAAVMQGSSWQRCKVHFYRNILAHVSQGRKKEVANALRAVFAQISMEAARRAASEFENTFAKSFPKAVDIFKGGLNDVLTFLAFPIEHHRKIASSNPIEHINREIRRRTRSIGIFPSVGSALRIVTMILIEQAEDWMVGRSYMSAESLELVMQM